MMKEKYAVLYDLSYRVHIYNFKYDYVVTWYAAIMDVIRVSSCDAYTIMYNSVDLGRSVPKQPWHSCVIQKIHYNYLQFLLLL